MKNNFHLNQMSTTTDITIDVPTQIQNILEKMSQLQFIDLMDTYKQIDMVREIAIKPPIIDQIITPSIKQNFTCRQSQSTSHKIQQTTFVENVLHSGLIDHQTCVIEIGAGKGELSYLFHQETDCQVFMIDINQPKRPVTNKISSNKVKYVVDNALTYDYANDSFLSGHKIVVVAKHLCGDIVDTTISTLLKSTLAPQIVGFFYSPCCYGRMTYDNYIHPATIANYTRDEFDFIKNKLIWGTFPTQKLHRDQYLPDLNRIGILFRDFLNQGRIHYLKSHKLKVKCYNYVHYDVTPQNLLICAVRQ